MNALYRAERDLVFYVAKLLLGDARLAENAVVAVFKDAWLGAQDAGLRTKADFRALVLSLTVAYCRRTITKKNAKAYRLPQNRDFMIVGDLVAPRDTAHIEEFVLSKFSDLQRLIFVLHNVIRCPNEEMSLALKLDAKTLTIALEAETENIRRILRANKKDDTCSVDAVAEYFLALQESTTAPESVDAAVAAGIDSVARPLEAQRTKRVLRKVIIAVTACVLAVGFMFMLAGIWDAIHGTGTSGETGTTTGTTTSTSSDNTTGADITEPVIDLDDALDYYADIEIKDYGTVTVKLEPEAAPITVANFVNLAQEGFYDGLTFHRIIEGFMMQGGDPNHGELVISDEETILGEFTSNGVKNDLLHTRGAISMARTNDPNSASSQFFIVQEESTHLDGDYAVFGYVTEGMDIVDAVCQAAEPTDDNGSIAYDDQPIIVGVTITTKAAE